MRARCLVAWLTILVGLTRGAEPAVPDGDYVTPEAITAKSFAVTPNPCRVKQTATAALDGLDAALPIELGSALLVVWTRGPEFTCNWGAFSDSSSPAAKGAFGAAGIHTVRVTVTVTGAADYSYLDGRGSQRLERKQVFGRRTFEANVLVQQADDVAVFLAAPGIVSVNQTGILVSATVVRGGERVAGAPVKFASDALQFPPLDNRTNDDGVAMVVAAAGPVPSPCRDGSHVAASVGDGAGRTIAARRELTVVKINDATPSHPKILVGGFSHNDLYSVVLTFTATPRLAGVPVTFAFAPGEGRGVDYPARLEEPSACTDISGQATIRVRSSDLRESPTVTCTYGASTGRATVTFEGITSVEMYEAK